MAILWCGGEDIDFPNGNAPFISLTAAYFRAGYARCAIGSNLSDPRTIKSTTFTPVTSCWATCRFLFQNGGGSPGWCYPLAIAKSGTNSYIGLSFNTQGNPYALSLAKVDAGVRTQLAVEAGTSIVNSTLTRFDLQIINYGATATVNVYANLILIISFTGNVSLAGVSNLDQVWMSQQSGNTGTATTCEFIVADEDTRGFPGLVTLALTGAGTTDQWTGLYSDINQTTISDATPNYTNTALQDQQYNVTDLPAGTFAIRAVKIAARSAVGAGAAVSKLSLGYNSGGTVAVGTPIVVPAGYATLEQLNLTNPVTSANWQQSEMNALQLNLRSVT